MAGRIRFVPFEFVVRNFNFRSDVDVRAAARPVRPVIGDDRPAAAIGRSEASYGPGILNILNFKHFEGGRRCECRP